MLLEIFGKMRNEGSQVSWSYNSESKEILSVFFQTQQQHELFQKFGDLIFIDVSSDVKRKEIENQPTKFYNIMVFSGIDLNGLNQIFAFAVLDDMRLENYAWAL